MVPGAVGTFVAGDRTVEAGPEPLFWLRRETPRTFASRGEEPARVFGTVSLGGVEAMFAEQEEYFRTLTGQPDEAYLRALSARYGVSELGPPLEVWPG